MRKAKVQFARDLIIAIFRADGDVIVAILLCEIIGVANVTGGKICNA